MKRRPMRWIALVSLIALLLAGCTSGGEDVLPDPDTSSIDDGDGGNGGDTGNDGNGTAPPPPDGGDGNETAPPEGNGTVPGNGTDGNSTPPAPEPVFFDGAEGDASQWTITGMVFVNPNLDGDTGQQTTEQPNPGNPEDPHPEGVQWSASAAQARTGTASWYSEYPDNYRTSMVSVAFEVPAGGATLTYRLLGGAEDTGVEGLFVLAGPAGGARSVVAEHRNALPDGWNEFTVDLAAGSTQIEFRFDTDLSCSNYSSAPPGFSCGEGYDAGGFYLDDITVA